MRLLFEMDKKDYCADGRVLVRPSARALIVRGEKVAMVHSLKYDYYKFPGGGIEAGEEPVAALLRETAEEAGLRIRPETVRAYGYVHRIQRSDHADAGVFLQDNFYYLCETEPAPIAQRLDDYEADEGFTLEWVAPQDAIHVNRSRDHGPACPLMLEREARVLELLMREGLLPCPGTPFLDIDALSARFAVRRLFAPDAELFCALAEKNTTYDRYHNSAPTRASFLEGLSALPPGAAATDKYYLGFFDGTRLVALCDLVLGYPNRDTAFIGLFMLEQAYQGKGVGSAIISDCAAYLRRCGFARLRLAVDHGNPQSLGFWMKNGFARTGEVYPNDFSAYLPMECPL